MPHESILVLDDEFEISELIRLYLEREQYRVTTVSTGQAAIQAVHELQPDLIILDILLPDMDGLEICRQIRDHTHVPILFLSCKGEDWDKISGLSVGADDYMTKPFSPGELVARVKAHLRRTHRQSIMIIPEASPENESLNFGELTINLTTHEVHIHGTVVQLSATEFNILHKLACQPGRVFPTEQLFDVIWGTDHFGDTRTVMVHISNLRKKIEVNPSMPQYIQTVRGVGYKFHAQPNSQRSPLIKGSLT
ncbi:response regulator transcription factor [Neobacillus mesonae]|nr:response regulator transcription factor [Neobacillus mesonae]